MEVVSDGTTAQLVTMSMSRRSLSPPRDLCNAAELTERAARAYEADRDNWVPNYMFTNPLLAGCFDARFIHETIRPLDVSRMGSVPDIVHFA